MKAVDLVWPCRDFSSCFHQLPDSVKAAEAERIAVIAQVKPAVAAVCFFGGTACGSGVIISDDGLCLTNFHVVQPTGPAP